MRSAALVGLIKLFTKNAPKGFAINRLTCVGEILPQSIIYKRLVTVVGRFSFRPEGIEKGEITFVSVNMIATLMTESFEIVAVKRRLPQNRM